MLSNNAISKVLNLGRLFIPQNYFYISLAGMKTKDAIQLPEKPKKPLSSFFRFMQEHKSVLMKEHPELKVTSIVKKCAEDWKTIHPTVKERYENEFKAEMETYIKKHLDYSMKLTDEQKEYMKQLSKEKSRSTEKRLFRKKLKELNKPKRPMSAFLLYLMDQSKIHGQKINEMMLTSKGGWHLVDETEKMAYVEKAEKLKEKYREDLKKWEDQMIQEGHTEFVRSKVLKEKEPVKNKKKSKKTESPIPHEKMDKNE